MCANVSVDLLIEHDAWEAIGLEALAQRACDAGALVAGLRMDVQVSLLAADDVRIRALNAQFRDKPAPTNVLSWPSEDRGGPPGEPPHRPTDPELGDIALSYETCVREASDFGKSVHDHVTHLILHGFLHLLGYDHVRDEDATVMEALEIEALATLGIDNPY